MLESAGLLRRDARFGAVGFDVVDKLRLVTACWEIRAPIVSERLGGFLRLRTIRDRATVRVKQSESERGFLAISRLTLSCLEASVADIQPRHSAIAGIPAPDKLRAVSLCPRICVRDSPLLCVAVRIMVSL